MNCLIEAVHVGGLMERFLKIKGEFAPSKGSRMRDSSRGAFWRISKLLLAYSEPLDRPAQ
jgi:hypothetical protein